MTSRNVSPKQKLLSNFALRLASDQQFMSSVLRKYQVHEKLTSEELASRFGISGEQLSLLSICRKPDSDSEEFEAQANQLASYSGVSKSFLIALIRQVDSMDALLGMPTIEEIEREHRSTQVIPAFAAARDRGDIEEENIREGRPDENNDAE